MKIAYILEWDISSDSGVFTKVKAQIAQWRNQGHIVELIAITPNSPKNNTNIKIFSTNFILNINGFLKTYLNKIISIHKVNRYLKEFNPDIVYIRQGIWYPGLPKFLNRYKSVIELNTDDLNEIKLEKPIKKYVYLYGRDKLIKSIAGFVSVSNEITNLYTKHHKPIVTISNGYDIQQIPDFRKNKNDRKQIIFVGSEGQKWHGVEKIFVMAENLPEFDFHIIGPKIVNTNKLFNLIIHGYKNKDDLFELYKSMDVGIGTLSLYENGMQEASPLKVREYISFGLPVILGYIDTDVDGKEYILNIGNYKENVKNNIEKIRDFINQSDRLHSLIDKKIISYEMKEKKRLEFFEKL